MKNFFVPEHSIMDFEFYDQRDVRMHLHQNLELLAVLEGVITVIVDEEAIVLNRGDYYLVNANRRHAIESDGTALYICLHINFNLLCRYVDMNSVMFLCSSGSAKADADRQMKKLLKQIVGYYFAKSGSGQVKLNVLYYQLLDTLIHNFMVYSEDERFRDSQKMDQLRLNEIVNYVYANYRDEISLTELADKLYLSTAYLSKYIKSRLAMNFTDYVNNVRLYYAVKEIQSTDKKMLHIAIDNGFPNIAAFNRAFKKIYNMTPMEYREQVRTAGSPLEEAGNRSKIAQKAKSYLEGISDVVGVEESEEIYVLGDAYEQQTYNKYWNRMINISQMSDLFSADIQKHILLLKDRLGFQYIRFWDIYAEELDLNIESDDGMYNFGKMDRIFDFLHENHIYPYIELGFKPVVLIEKLDGYIVEKEREILFPSYEKHGDFLYALLTHYVNRYGIEEVEKWYFELWKDPRLIEDEDHYESYFQLFEVLYNAVKSVSSLIRIGGGSIHFTYDSHRYRQLLSQWKNRMVYPDFITLYSYPYHVGEYGNVVDQRRSQNPDYLKNQVEAVKDCMSRMGIHVSEIQVSEWNSSVSNRNIMNDSVYKGAYIVKNVLDNIGNLELLGYWLGSDLFSQSRDLNQVLNGGVGLLSRDGIKKPAYFAFDFLNHLGRFIIGRNENSVITSNLHDDYFIVNHNYKHPNYKYYATPENEIDIENMEQYFDNLDSIRLNYQIKNVRNGKYQIKVRKVNREYGSVQNEWLRLGRFDNLTISDVDYLRQMATAKIVMWESEVYDNTLNFESVLTANEIQYIHITYRL